MVDQDDRVELIVSFVDFVWTRKLTLIILSVTNAMLDASTEVISYVASSIV